MAETLEAVELREAYDFTCVACGYQQVLKPSIAMMMGRNSGHGVCKNCKDFLHLEIVPDLSGTEAKSQKRDDYMAENHPSEPPK